MKKIGLVLGGGGAMGIAHLALLEEIEKNNIRISSIAGTSVGAIIGGLYASGGLELVKKFIDVLKEKKLLTRKNLLLSGRPDNFFQKIEEILSDLIKNDNFSLLNCDFSVVAVDLKNGEPVIIKKGSIVKALLASSAYPGVFLPQVIGNRTLIDGGVVNNLPVDILKKENFDLIIASSLNNLTRIKKGRKLSRAGVAIRAIDIMQLSTEREQAKKADFLFRPKTSEFRWFHFDRIDSIYEIGKKSAKKAIPKLVKLIES
jgi:NTE family protein